MLRAASIERTRGRARALPNKLTTLLDKRVPVLYPAPAFAVLFILFLAPIVYTLYLSVHTWNFSPTRAPVPIGLDNYAELFTEPRFHRAVFNTFYYTALALPIQLCIGIGMALLFNRPFRGRG